MSFNEWHFNEFCKDNYDLESDQQKAIYDRIHSHASEKSKKDAQEEAWGFQQDKIDELNEKHSEEKRILHNVIEMNQAKIDELKSKVDELKKHSLMLREAANSWTYSEGEKNILISQADDLDRILKGNKDEN